MGRKHGWLKRAALVQPFLSKKSIGNSQEQCLDVGHRDVKSAARCRYELLLINTSDLLITFLSKKSADNSLERALACYTLFRQKEKVIRC